MAAPGIPVVTNIDGTTGPTLGGWWITLSGTGFWNARDVVDSVILQYLYLGDPFSITLTKGFDYYAANDSNFLILVPSSLSYIDKSNSNQSPPRTVLTASSLITSIEVSANGNAVFPPPLSFTYEYMPQLERIDAGTPVLWTGQTSIGIGTATLSVPAATDMTASLSSSTTGITFLDATGVAPLPSNRITFPATEDSATFSMALSAAASPGMSKITATPSNFGGAVPAPAIVQISADQIVLVVTSSTPSVLPNVISVIAGQPFTATVYVRATAAGGVSLSLTSPGNEVSIKLPSVTINPAPGDSGSGVSQQLELIADLIRGFGGSVAITATQGSNQDTVHIQVNRASPSPPPTPKPV